MVSAWLLLGKKARVSISFFSPSIRKICHWMSGASMKNPTPSSIITYLHKAISMHYIMTQAVVGGGGFSSECGGVVWDGIVAPKQRHSFGLCVIFDCQFMLCKRKGVANEVVLLLPHLENSCCICCSIPESSATMPRRSSLLLLTTTSCTLLLASLINQSISPLLLSNPLFEFIRLRQEVLKYLA